MRTHIMLFRANLINALQILKKIAIVRVLTKLSYSHSNSHRFRNFINKLIRMSYLDPLLVEPFGVRTESLIIYLELQLSNNIFKHEGETDHQT